MIRDGILDDSDDLDRFDSEIASMTKANAGARVPGVYGASCMVHAEEPSLVTGPATRPRIAA
jgi:hypothetical protein